MTIVLIDLSQIVHAAYHVSTADPNPDATSIAAVAKVRALASGQPHVAVCIDTGRSFRRDVSPDYKANRPEQDGALKHQMALTIDTLRGDGFPVWGAPGFEADDVIASAVECAASSTPHLHDVERTVPCWCGAMPTELHALVPPPMLVCSSDKDLLQLVADRVQVKSLNNGTVYDAAAVQEKFGVAPHQMHDYLCLVGDASDNVKGAQGIGAKTAAKLLGTFGNLHDLYAAIDAKTADLTPACLRSLEEFRPRWPMVRELITLRRDVAVDFQQIFAERVPADVAVFGEEESTMEPKESAPQAPAAGAGEAPPTESPAGPSPAASTAMTPVAGSTSPAPAPEVLPAPAEWERQLEPRSFGQTLQLGNVLHKSRLFSAYGSAEAVASTILAGRELGIPAMAALRGFHIIEGKPCMSADLIRAMVVQSDQCEYFRCTERTPERATFVTKRKGDPEIALSFSIDEARQAWAKRDKDGNVDERSWAASGWGRNPADMCVARASAKLARLVYPEIVHGFYAPEEMQS